ncbi:MAG: alpha/beta hydrolase, partial [Bacteroidetes bacterium]
MNTKSKARLNFIYVLYSILGTMIILLLFNYKSDIPPEKLKEKYCNEHSQFIKIDGMDVHFRDEGAGMPFVLIHGTAASLHTWDEWAEKLVETHRVIRMDLPAFGLTGPHSSRDYSIESYTMFLNQFLDSLDIDSFYLAGNSLGGNIAWNFTAAYPEKVKKLILVDASGYPMEDGHSWIFTLARTPVLNQIMKKLTPRFFISNNLRQVYYDDEKIKEEVITRYHQMALRAGNRQAFIDRAKTEYEDLSSKIKTIQTPTLILWGAHDTWVPVNHAHRFKEDLPDSKMVILENSGHIPMEENPEESLRSVLEF